MSTPEPCLNAPCRSPIACGGWGYCRERNFKIRSEMTMNPNLIKQYMAGCRLDATLARVDAALNEDEEP